jgi:hypothetical protein
MALHEIAWMHVHLYVTISLHYNDLFVEFLTNVMLQVLPAGGVCVRLRRFRHLRRNTPLEFPSMHWVACWLFMICSLICLIFLPVSGSPSRVHLCGGCLWRFAGLRKKHAAVFVGACTLWAPATLMMNKKEIN